MQRNPARCTRPGTKGLHGHTRFGNSYMFRSCMLARSVVTRDSSSSLPRMNDEDVGVSTENSSLGSLCAAIRNLHKVPYPEVAELV
mmetsp:Transcript_21978/g.50329  ORF Transcript_21978/g.50329 Transcript_21978/m.50329 type:complete len:86 (-) Transcript_21978:115-372(-)